MFYILFALLGLGALIWQFFLEKGSSKKLLAVISILSFVGLAYIGYSDSRKLLDKLNYSEVSKLNYVGLPPVNGEGGIEISTPLSRLLGSIVNPSPFEIICSEPSLDSFSVAIKENPKFPFSYYYRAVCEKSFDLPGSEADFAKARNILMITTEIPDHHLNHDEVLKMINENQGFYPK